MVAIIPAGGEGTRLKPLSIGTPKPFLKLMDKPIIDYVIKNLLKHGIKNIKIITGVISPPYCEPENADIAFIKESQPMGTAGGLYHINEDCENFLIIYGDIVSDFNLTGLISFHKSEDAEITVGVANDKGCGIYAVSKRVLPLINPPIDMGELILKCHSLNKKVAIFKDNCIFFDIDNLSDFKNLNQCLLKESALLKHLSPERDINTTKNVIIGDNSHLEVGSSITPPVYIGKNVYIEAGAEIGAFSVIGENCKLYKNSRTEASVIMANSLVSGNAFLKNTVISENTRIKRGAKIYEDTVIGENCIIGENSIINPHVCIWPDKITEE